MEGTLRVTPQQLQSTASEFNTQAGEISTLTSNMTQLVNSLAGVWTGTASEAYRSKFNGLNDDIQHLIAMVKEHSNDLNEMAQVYINAEQSNEEVIQNLSADVIV